MTLSSPPVVVVGESLVDEIRSPHGSVERIGGSCLNVAVGLSRLGRAVTFVTSFGDDEAGRAIARHLSGMDVVRATAPTSRALADVDRDGVARYEFCFSWELGDVVLDVPPESHLHVGSLGAVCPPGADPVLDAVRRHAGTVSYDLNWRDGAAPVNARERVERLMSLATVVKLSEEDADALFPGTSPEDLARRMLATGPEVLVLTRGAEGAEAWTSSAHVQAPTPPGEPVVDTVGAGDAFMAGFLHHWLEHRDVRRALMLACLVARLTCERPGADPPTEEELRQAQERGAVL